jgi:hypothetical protein
MAQDNDKRRFLMPSYSSPAVRTSASQGPFSRTIDEEACDRMLGHICSIKHVGLIRERVRFAVFITACAGS